MIILRRFFPLSISKELSKPDRVYIASISSTSSGFSIIYLKKKKKNELNRIIAVNGIRTFIISIMILITIVNFLITLIKRINLE